MPNKFQFAIDPKLQGIKFEFDTESLVRGIVIHVFFYSPNDMLHSDNSRKLYCDDQYYLYKYNFQKKAQIRTYG